MNPALTGLPANRRRGTMMYDGLTLPEVMIALLVVTGLCLSVFAGLFAVSKWSLHTAIRGEAQRLMQAEAERLVSVPFADFGVVADQVITSSVNTTFSPGTQARFSHPAPNAGARVTFTRRVVELASTTTSRTLQIQLGWNWQGQSFAIAWPVFRTR